MRAVDLFAGPGGWTLGARSLGIQEVGLELDPDACATRAAAGLATIRTDVATYPAARFRGWDGVIASPPCQDYSLAGKRAGRSSARGALVDTVPTWVEAIGPSWVVCEEVPAVLPIWQEHARRYRELGFLVWVGVLEAADYGVPQTRSRAVLIARRDGLPLAPEPSHGKVPRGVPRWVSMASALGWPAELRVGFPRLDDRGDSPDGYRVRDWRRASSPAFTLTEKARSWSVDEGGARRPLELTEALALQSFPADHPLVGTRSSRFRQVGNAVPPLLARAILREATGL